MIFPLLVILCSDKDVKAFGVEISAFDLKLIKEEGDAEVPPLPFFASFLFGQSTQTDK